MTVLGPGDMLWHFHLCPLGLEKELVYNMLDRNNAIGYHALQHTDEHILTNRRWLNRFLSEFSADVSGSYLLLANIYFSWRNCQYYTRKCGQKLCDRHVQFVYVCQGRSLT